MIGLYIDWWLYHLYPQFVSEILRWLARIAQTSRIAPNEMKCLVANLAKSQFPQWNIYYHILCQLAPRKSSRRASWRSKALPGALTSTSCNDRCGCIFLDFFLDFCGDLCGVIGPELEIYWGILWKGWVKLVIIKIRRRCVYKRKLLLT